MPDRPALGNVLATIAQVSGPVVSLLPARNSAEDLPGHLDSVGRFADAVVALDDGSTDDTRSILEAHPLVVTVLSNPRREGYAGWDDAANRNRLLEAALELRPSWAMSLDSDELISADDASTLRSFLLHHADPEDAYLFRVFRMIGDLDHHDGSELWVGRLFAPRPEHRFPSDKLHFVPLPTAIPNDRWRKTTIRIQHRGSLTDEQRKARFAKYREADPDRTWQSSYDHLLRAPDEPRRWWPRGRMLPVVVNDPSPVDDERRLPTGEEEEGPAAASLIISVVVLAMDAAADPVGERELMARIDSASSQSLDLDFEVLTVTTASLAATVSAARPDVGVVVIEGDPSPGAIRNLALDSASGLHVVFVEESTTLASGFLKALVDAHAAGWPMVAGVDDRLPAAWIDRADFLLERSPELPGRGSFRFDQPPRSCSFRRELLDEIGGFDETVPAGVEAVAAAELFERGYGAYRTCAAVQRRGRRSPGPGWLAERYAAGRTQGLVLAASVRAGAISPKRAIRRVVRSLPGNLRRIARDVSRWAGPDLGRARSVAPLVVVGAVVSWVGTVAHVARQVLGWRTPARPRPSLTR